LLKGVYSTTGGGLNLACDDAVGRAEVDGVACTLHGRLYEPRRLATELELDPGTEPAAMLASAYRRYGEGLPAKLRGRFAVAIWDEAAGRGALACDPLCAQPLFFCRGAGCLVFAGELQALLSMLPATPGPDPEGFLAWLGGWTVPAERTLYEGVHRLAPGQLLSLRGEVSVREHWRPRYEGTLRGSRKELARGLADRVDRAVARRISASASGVVLSGGLDSSIVTASAQRASPPGSTLKTYSAIFPGEEFDEAWKVRSLTTAIGVDAQLFELEPQGSLWLNLFHLKRWGQPLGGSGALLDMTMVEAAARDGVEVVLDGQTGDEVFGCSPWLVADRLARGRLLAALELTRRWPGMRTNARERRYILEHWGLKGLLPYRLHRMRHERKDPNLLAPGWLRAELRAPYAELEDRWAWKRTARGPRWWRYLADVLVLAPHRELRLDYLRNRAAGAGVSGESPLYDFDLIEYSLRLPPQLAFDAAFSRPLVRESMRGRIPDEVRLDGRKAIFSPFCFDMLTGADAPGIEGLILDRKAELGAYADLDLVERLWSGERPDRRAGLGTASWGTVVWRLAAAESWLRTLADSGFAERMMESPAAPRPAVKPVCV